MLADLVDARAARKPLAVPRQSDNLGSRRCDPPTRPPPPSSAPTNPGVEGDCFIAIHNPPLRLAIVGAVHIAQHLVPMARACGYDVMVIDPRAAFGSAERFPGVTLSPDWPDEALEAFQIDTRTAVVTLTHDTKLDDPALRAALKSQAFYIGCLGSTRTHAKRVARLTEAGFTETDLARLHAPVGLNIGAATPAEIAVSVMAQIIQTLRRPA